MPIRKANDLRLDRVLGPYARYLTLLNRKEVDEVIELLKIIEAFPIEGRLTTRIRRSKFRQDVQSVQLDSHRTLVSEQLRRSYPHQSIDYIDGDFISESAIIVSALQIQSQRPQGIVHIQGVEFTREEMSVRSMNQRLYVFFVQ